MSSSFSTTRGRVQPRMLACLAGTGELLSFPLLVAPLQRRTLPRPFSLFLPFPALWVLLDALCSLPGASFLLNAERLGERGCQKCRLETGDVFSRGRKIFKSWPKSFVPKRQCLPALPLRRVGEIYWGLEGTPFRPAALPSWLFTSVP